jgi:hypothetical protein
MIFSPLKTPQNPGGKSHGFILLLDLERLGFFSLLCPKADFLPEKKLLGYNSGAYLGFCRGDAHFWLIPPPPTKNKIETELKKS